MALGGALGHVTVNVVSDHAGWVMLGVGALLHFTARPCITWLCFAFPTRLLACLQLCHPKEHLLSCLHNTSDPCHSPIVCCLTFRFLLLSVFFSIRCHKEAQHIRARISHIKQYTAKHRAQPQRTSSCSASVHLQIAFDSLLSI